MRKDKMIAMRHFRTFVITKKTIIRAALAFLALLGAVGICTAAVLTPKSVQTFSDSSIPEAILDEGVPREDDGFDITGFISGLLGFDTDNPETILESSSSVIAENKSKPDTSETIEQTIEQTPAPTESLPSHDEIITASGLRINNATGYNVDLDALCAEDLGIQLDFEKPEVLIVHTHTTECFLGDEMTGESERTTNEQYNMCAIGDIIKNTLTDYGIGVVHDKTIHDYPTYKGSYSNALETIEKNIEQYPSIKVILDVHRDAYIYNDGSKLRVSTDIDGKSTAQVMLVLGTDSMGLYHPYWRSNLTLASKLQNAAEIMYPGLMRPLNLRRERFNMHVRTGSLLLEVGSNGNTLDEAKLGAQYIAKALAAVLLNG